MDPHAAIILYKYACMYTEKERRKRQTDEHKSVNKGCKRGEEWCIGGI